MLSRRSALGAAAAGGALLALSQPSYDLWPLAWFGLAPLLAALRGRSPRQAFAVAWSGWFVFSLLVLYWIAPTISNFTSVPVPIASIIMLLLCAVSSVYVGVFGAMLEWIAAAGISRVVAAPLVWVSIEWVRTFFPAEFPWAFLGYSQHAVLPVVQIADVGAIYAVSALLVFVNATLAELTTGGGLRRHVGLVAAAVTLVVLDVGYGYVRLAQVRAQPVRGELAVGVAQANIPQDVKWDPAYQESTLETYLQLSEQAVEQGAQLVVWPEAAVPFFLYSDPRAARIRSFSDSTGAWMLIGAPGYERRPGDKPRQYNQAWLLAPERGFSGPYDKIVLVPFGEYVPFGGMFGFVEKAVEAVGDFGRGTRTLVFDGPPLDRPLADSEQDAGGIAASDNAPVGLGPLICYEGIFPDLVRRFVRDGAGLLVNISNDAWYGATSAPHQHLAMAAMRAIENRVPMVRSTNTGISAVIAPTGEVRSTTPLFQRTVFVDHVALVDGGSVYTALGDVFVYSCLVGVAGLAYLRRRLGAVSIGV